MNLAITIFDIAMMTLVSWVFLKKPLEEKISKVVSLYWYVLLSVSLLGWLSAL